MFQGSHETTLVIIHLYCMQDYSTNSSYSYNIIIVVLGHDKTNNNVKLWYSVHSSTLYCFVLFSITGSIWARWWSVWVGSCSPLPGNKDKGSLTQVPDQWNRRRNLCCHWNGESNTLLTICCVCHDCNCLRCQWYYMYLFHILFRTILLKHVYTTNIIDRCLDVAFDTYLWIINNQVDC